MPQGYMNGKPEWAYWKQRIKDGKEFRRKAAYESSWRRWREYYRGEWHGDILPVNLFFSMLRTIVPRLYFRNPSISIRPSKPGHINAVFAKILERIDTRLIREMDVKREMRMAIQETWMFGSSFAKSGFGTAFDPVMESGKGLSMKGEREILEYNSSVRPAMPWVMKTSAGSVVLPAGCRHIKEARWTAECIKRPIDDVRGDKRLSNRTYLRPSANKGASPFVSGIGPIKEEMLELWEVRDKKTGEVFILTDDVDAGDKNSRHTLLQGEDFYLRTNQSFALKMFVFNEDDERAWGIPDSKILEPYQMEINEIKTQLMFHRRMATSKIMARVNSITRDQAERFVDESILPVIYMNGDPTRDVRILESMPIPPELRIAAVDVVQDMRETAGFGRNQFGEFNPGSSDTTATEAQIVRQASEIRVDERRDIVADIMLDIFADVHQVIFNFWRDEQVVDLVGPGAQPLWVRFTGTELARSAFSILVDPDNSVPETKAVREQRALSLFERLRSNPLIDPVKLTQYLLTNLSGVQFDDLMAVIPPVPQGAQNGPVSPQQVPQVMQQRLAAAAPAGSA